PSISLPAIPPIVTGVGPAVRVSCGSATSHARRSAGTGAPTSPGEGGSTDVGVVMTITPSPLPIGIPATSSPPPTNVLTRLLTLQPAGTVNRTAGRNCSVW